MLILSHLKKELRLLCRDRLGMLTLFAMPAIFLLVISIIQFHTLEQNGPSLTLYLFNQDQGALSKQLITQIKRQPNIKITELNPAEQAQINAAKRQVISHANTMLIDISAGASKYFSQTIKQHTIGQRSVEKIVPIINITTSPSAPRVFIDAINRQMQQVLNQLQLQAAHAVVSEVLASPTSAPIRLATFIHFNQASHSQDNNSTILRNVSAWAVFGMFFIIIPAAGTLLRERDCGVLDRIFIAPNQKFGFLLGKMLSYLLINFSQLILMFIIAYFVFPLLQLPRLELTATTLSLSTHLTH